jgi:membrane-associated PAP2 superfamily phosphatase
LNVDADFVISDEDLTERRFSLRRNKPQLLIVIALVLLGFLVAAVTQWLGLSRPWVYVIVALVGAVAVYLVMRNSRNQV